MSQDAFPELQCGVCLEIPPLPWRSCRYGHPICAACYDQLPDPRCPTCHVDMTVRMRQLLAEQLVEHLGLPVRARCPHPGCAEHLTFAALDAHRRQCAHRLLDDCPARTAGLPCVQGCPDGCCVKDVLAQIRACWPETIVADALPSHMPLAVESAGQWIPRAWIFRNEGLFVTHDGEDDFRLRFWTLALAPLPITYTVSTGSMEYHITANGVAPFVGDAAGVPEDECGVLLPTAIRDTATTTLTVIVRQPVNNAQVGPPTKKRRRDSKTR